MIYVSDASTLPLFWSCIAVLTQGGVVCVRALARACVRATATQLPCMSYRSLSVGRKRGTDIPKLWNNEVKSDFINRYEGVSKSFRTGRLERELQLLQLSATRCSCIAILWVSLVSFAAITICVSSQRVLFTSLSTQSGNFWSHHRIVLSYKR
jgi:hypothetical protein